VTSSSEFHDESRSSGTENDDWLRVCQRVVANSMKSGSSQRDIGVQARSEVRVGENHGENRGEHRGSRQGGLMKSGEVGSSDFKGWRQINQCWTAR